MTSLSDGQRLLMAVCVWHAFVCDDKFPGADAYSGAVWETKQQKTLQIKPNAHAGVYLMGVSDSDVWVLVQSQTLNAAVRNKLMTEMQSFHYVLTPVGWKAGQRAIKQHRQWYGEAHLKRFVNPGTPPKRAKKDRGKPHPATSFYPPPTTFNWFEQPLPDWKELLK